MAILKVEWWRNCCENMLNESGENEVVDVGSEKQARSISALG
jgi:hypothetical protein